MQLDMYDYWLGNTPPERVPLLTQPPELAQQPAPQLRGYMNASRRGVILGG